MDTSLPKRDVELGAMSSPSLLPPGHLDERKGDPFFEVEAVDPNAREEPQGCQQKCWHGARPRDWSEYFIVPGGLMALGFGVFHALQDTNEWVAAPSFAVGLICMLAEVRIRQLWITKTLDDEAQAFRQNNRSLKGRVTELSATTQQLGSENGALKKSVAELGADNAQIRKENQRFSAELEAQRKQLAEMQSVRERLQRDVAALKKAAQQIDGALEEERGNGDHLEKISDLEQQLLALERAEQEEAKRHARSMGNNE